MVKFIGKQYKSILNRQKYIDSWFWGRYTINPYNGCQFGCTYCDSRSEHYHMPADFENQIVIKQNTADMLDKRISRARTLLPDVVVIGGVTDGYQPAEKKYENTRGMLEVLLKHGYPVHIITKSPLVLRDLDLLDAIGEKTWCSVSITATTLDEKMASFVDFRAPAPQKRVDALAEIKARAPNVQAGILLIPLIPFLCDSAESIQAVVRAASENGADYLLFGSAMTLRNVQAGWFLTRLSQKFPDVYADYKTLYGFSRHNPYNGRYFPAGSYMRAKNQFLFEQCRERGLPSRMCRFLPQDWRRTAYRVSEFLLVEAYRYEMMGKANKNMFWAGQNIQNLKEPLEDVAARGDLDKIRNVQGPVLNRVQKLIEDPSIIAGRGVPRSRL